MTTADIVAHRLVNQQLVQANFQKPDEIVALLGAVQAQEYAMAKWAIGLRLPGLTDADVENAFNNGSILRTHLLRPTWHFVTPADIRWMLALTAPRVDAVNAHMYRKLELDRVVFSRAYDILTETLGGGKQFTRTRLKIALEQGGIVADGFRLSYLLMRAELEGIICSGARHGKQFTYALLNERVPCARLLDRDEALAELARRYFTSRGPATLPDFVWWSGLTMKDARAGVALLGSDFVHVTVDGQAYVVSPARLAATTNGVPTAFLLPDYDEYGIGYKDRNALFNSPTEATESKDEKRMYDRLLVIEGVVAGSWKRTLKTDSVLVEISPSTPLNATKQEAVRNAIQRYSSFLALPAVQPERLKSAPD